MCRKIIDLARELLPRLKTIPGAADVHIQQAYDQPQLNIDVDRTKAQQVGMTETTVVQQRHGFADQQLSNGAQFLGEPAGRHLQIATQTPQYRMDSLPDLRELPVITANGAGTQEQLIENLASITRESGLAVASQYDISRWWIRL